MGQSGRTDNVSLGGSAAPSPSPTSPGSPLSHADSAASRTAHVALEGSAAARTLSDEGISLTGSALQAAGTPSRPAAAADVSLTGSAVGGLSITGGALNSSEADKTTRVAASIGASAPAAAAEPTTTVSARVQTGVQIHARDNHYYDPISRQILTLHFGDQVPRERWQECTEDLVGSVCARLQLFLQQQSEREGLAFTFQDVKGYTFDWKGGQVSIEFKSGASYSFNCASAMSEAMRPHLREPKEADNLPTPSAIESGLQGLNPPLEPLQDAFIHRLAFDRGMVRRLEYALRETSAPTHREHNSDKIKGYKVLLHILHGLRHGARLSLSDEDRQRLSKLLNSQLGFFSSFTKRKLTRSGNPLLGEALSHFRQELQNYRPPASETQRYHPLTLSEAASGACVDLLAYLRGNQGPRLPGRPSDHRHLGIDIDSPQRDWSRATPALQGRPTLHLEPEVDLARSGQRPVWAHVTSVVCHSAGEEGSSSKQAQYTHFARDGDGKWWQLSQGSCQEVKWSQVQAMAALSAVHVGLDIDPVVTTSPGPASIAGLTPSPTPAVSGSAPLPRLILDTGGCEIPDGYTPIDWSFLDASCPNVRAIQDLRADQAQRLTQDDDGPKNHKALWQRFYPALQPKLTSQGASLYDPVETLSSASKASVRQFFTQLSQELTSNTLQMEHALPQALTHEDLQQMADLIGQKIIVYTQTEAVTYTPQDTSRLDPDQTLHYAAPSLDPADPTATCRLTPLLPSAQAQAAKAAKAARLRAARSPSSATATIGGSPSPIGSPAAGASSRYRSVSASSSPHSAHSAPGTTHPVAAPPPLRRARSAEDLTRGAAAEDSYVDLEGDGESLLGDGSAAPLDHVRPGARTPSRYEEVPSDDEDEDEPLSVRTRKEPQRAPTRTFEGPAAAAAAAAASRDAVDPSDIRFIERRDGPQPSTGADSPTSLRRRPSTDTEGYTRLEDDRADGEAGRGLPSPRSTHRQGTTPQTYHSLSDSDDSDSEDEFV